MSEFTNEQKKEIRRIAAKAILVESTKGVLPWVVRFFPSISTWKLARVICWLITFAGAFLKYDGAYHVMKDGFDDIPKMAHASLYKWPAAPMNVQSCHYPPLPVGTPSVAINLPAGTSGTNGTNHYIASTMSIGITGSPFTMDLTTGTGIIPKAKAPNFPYDDFV